MVYRQTTVTAEYKMETEQEDERSSLKRDGWALNRDGLWSAPERWASSGDVSPCLEQIDSLFDDVGSLFEESGVALNRRVPSD